MKVARVKRGQRVEEFIKFLWERRGMNGVGITTNSVAKQLGHAHGNAYKILSRLNYLIPELVEKFSGYWIIKNSENILTLPYCLKLYKIRAKVKRKNASIKKVRKNMVQKPVKYGLWGVQHKMKNNTATKSYESVLDKEKMIPINKDVPVPVQYTIDKNVPMPVKPFYPRSQYPLEIMDIGDSFFVPVPLGRLVNVRNSVFALAARKFNSNKKFKTRKEGDGIRVWRVV